MKKLLLFSLFSILAATSAQAQTPLKDTATFFATVHGTVWAMQTIGDSFYVAGNFDSIAGIPANNIARWNGTSWSNLGTGIHGEIRVITSDGQRGLYAGGKFDSAGNIPTSNIAHWNGSEWDSLGAGVNDSVFALFNTDSQLYCGGAFTSAGIWNARRIATWNSSNRWDTLGYGFDGTVRGIGHFFFGATPWIVGEFTGFSNQGTYSAPLYCISTLNMNTDLFGGGYGSLQTSIIAGTGTIFSDLYYNSTYKNLAWLWNVPIHGSVFGIAPMGSKSFFTWGNFDSIDHIALPGMAVFDGTQWRGIHNAYHGAVTAAGAFDSKILFSEDTNNSHSIILTYTRPDTINAVFYSPTNQLSNDSSSNAPLLYQYAFSYGFNCFCMSNCNFSGSITPGQNVHLGSFVEPEEQAPWNYFAVEVDNSTNESGPNSITGSSSPSKVDEPIIPPFTILGTSEGFTFLIPTQSGSLSIYNLLAQQIYTAHDLHSTSLSLDTRSWPDGTYIACYTGADGSATAKFIVRH